MQALHPPQLYHFRMVLMQLYEDLRYQYLVDAFDDFLARLAHEVIGDIAAFPEVVGLRRSKSRVVNAGVFLTGRTEPLQHRLHKVALGAGTQDEGDHAQEQDDGHPNLLVFAEIGKWIESHGEPQVRTSCPAAAAGGKA